MQILPQARRDPPSPSSKRGLATACHHFRQQRSLLFRGPLPSALDARQNRHLRGAALRQELQKEIPERQACIIGLDKIHASGLGACGQDRYSRISSR